MNCCRPRPTPADYLDGISQSGYQKKQCVYRTRMVVLAIISLYPIINIIGLIACSMNKKHTYCRWQTAETPRLTGILLTLVMICCGINWLFANPARTYDRRYRPLNLEDVFADAP